METIPLCPRDVNRSYGSYDANLFVLNFKKAEMLMDLFYSLDSGEAAKVVGPLSRRLAILLALIDALHQSVSERRGRV